MAVFSLVGVSIVLFAAISTRVRACTTLAIDPGATTDACSYTTSTSDCRDCDFRLAFVPARSHPKGSQRPVYQVRFSYPHVVSNRAFTWGRSNLQGSKSQLSAWTNSKPIGFVPQVGKTFALFESGSSYGLMNENQVSIGESTCPAIFASKPVSDGGKALLDVSELSKIALERATTAREAIEIMGFHATTYGYYGAEWDLETKFAESGETLTIADKHEAWIFHVLPDDTGASAVWAAQKVPKGHITAVANFFIIRGVDLSNKESFMASDNLYTVARRNKVTKTNSDGLLDFAATYGLQQPHPSYTTLRRWRVLTIADPLLAGVLNSTTDSDLPPDYPFSAKVRRKLSPEAILAIQRDHFDGTVYDLTRGVAAGPYGDPDRYDSEAVDDMSLERATSGEFARGISMFRTSYATVGRGCAHLPNQVGAMIRFAQQQPDASSFIPLYLAGGRVPSQLSRGSLFRVDDESYFWRVALVSNWAHRYYRHAIPIIREVQQQLEQPSRIDHFDQLLKKAIEQGHTVFARIEMRKFSADAASRAMQMYKKLFPELVAKVHDGYIMRDPEATTITMNSFFYPEEWLERVGYFVNKETNIEKGREALRRAHSRAHNLSMGLNVKESAETAPLYSSITATQSAQSTDYRSFWGGTLFGIIGCIAVMYAYKSIKKQRTGYVPIDA